MVTWKPKHTKPPRSVAVTLTCLGLLVSHNHYSMSAVKSNDAMQKLTLIALNTRV